jgi:hypothetical protein
MDSSHSRVSDGSASSIFEVSNIRAAPARHVGNGAASSSNDLTGMPC